MTMRHVPPAEAFAMIEAGAVLVDIREPDEHAREHIPGARPHPLSRIASAPPEARGVVIFHCRSGNRTTVNEAALAASVPGATAHLLEGGIEAWRDAGFATRKDHRKPIEIMRQVQIGAGALVLAGAVLGAWLHPGLHAMSALVGAGLVVAGASGFCGMARLLALAPWNRTGKPATT